MWRAAKKPAKKRPPRRSVFDTLSAASEVENKYCRIDDLDNEAAVETFFVNRMLLDLEYKDKDIKTKKSIKQLTVSFGGSKSGPYKPDYVLCHRKKPRWVIDAKHPNEPLDKWVAQCSGYCLGLNQAFKAGENHVQWFLLTNGVETRVYAWDHHEPELVLAFADFEDGNPKYEQLRKLLAAPNLAQPKKLDVQSTFKFQRPTAEQAKGIFAQCHRMIWKSEGRNPTAAFMEFTKLMFVKLWCDRELRRDEKTKSILEQEGEVKLPKDSVVFSLHWIQQRVDEKASTNPVNDILFATLRKDIEKDVAHRKKKRIFEKDETIRLSADTVKAVVDRLQHYDMFGIDEDLNGRLFETFLSATMRGRELGQFFTPRSIVKLMTRMAVMAASVECKRSARDRVLNTTECSE